MRRDTENGMIIGSDYEPMLYPNDAVHICDWCGAPIYPGEKYLDVGDLYCEECIRKHTKEAKHE